MHVLLALDDLLWFPYIIYHYVLSSDIILSMKKNLYLILSRDGNWALPSLPVPIRCGVVFWRYTAGPSRAGRGLETSCPIPYRKMCKPLWAVPQDVTENTILAASSYFCFYETSQKTPNTIRVNHKTCQAKTNRTQVVHSVNPIPLFSNLYKCLKCNQSDHHSPVLRWLLLYSRPSFSSFFLSCLHFLLMLIWNTVN